MWDIKNISRREFMRFSTYTAIGIMASACVGASTPAPSAGAAQSSSSPSPFEVKIRPFAIDRSTGLMMWDGIFDATVGVSDIGIYFTPTRNSKDDPYYTQFPPGKTYAYDVLVERYTGENTTASSGIKLLQSTITMPDSFNLGESILNVIQADFSNAEIGKHRLVLTPRIPGRSEPQTQWTIKSPVMFVAKTKSSAAGGVVVEVPEGECRFQLLEAFTIPVLPYGMDATKDNWHAKNEILKLTPIILPKKFTVEVTLKSPLTGQYLPLPFQDSWWKNLVGIVSGTLAAAGVTGLKGGCEAIVEPTSVAACNAAAIAAIIIGAGLSYLPIKEEKDPFRIGQDLLHLSSENEKTIKETVTVNVDYLSKVVGLGVPSNMKVNWEYTRYTDLQEYKYADSWEAQNQFTLSKTTVTTDKAAYNVSSDQITITAAADGPQGQMIKGEDAYVLAILYGPHLVASFNAGMDLNQVYKDEIKILVLADKEGSGKYTGSVYAEVLKKSGEWWVYAVFQKVNKFVATLDLNDPSSDQVVTEAAESANNVGGIIQNAFLVVNNPQATTCPLNSDQVCVANAKFKLN